MRSSGRSTTYQRRARLGDEVPLGDPDTMVQRVLRSITELGPLSELLARRDVEEIFVEGARVTYLDTAGRLRGLADPTTEDENRQIVDRLLAVTERQLNAKHPIVQARVLNGSARLTAAIPPVADRLSATVRRYTVRDVTLDALVARNALSEEAGAFLWAIMQLRSRIVISGEPGAGKTTLAAALMSAVPPAHCVRSCEEIRELAVPLVHGGYYEVRAPGLDGTGEISLARSRQVRPGDAARSHRRRRSARSRSVRAHPGHQRRVRLSLHDSRQRRARRVERARQRRADGRARTSPSRSCGAVFIEALDLVVHVDRDDTSQSEGRVRRQVTEITAVVPSLGDGQTCEPLFVRERLGRPLEWTGAMPPGLEERGRSGTAARHALAIAHRTRTDSGVNLLAALLHRCVLRAGGRFVDGNAPDVPAVAAAPRAIVAVTRVAPAGRGWALAGAVLGGKHRRRACSRC